MHACMRCTYNVPFVRSRHLLLQCVGLNAIPVSFITYKPINPTRKMIVENMTKTNDKNADDPEMAKP